MPLTGQQRGGRVTPVLKLDPAARRAARAWLLVMVLSVGKRQPWLGMRFKGC